jgi:calcineurin-like phosphoesterase family protein
VSRRRRVAVTAALAVLVVSTLSTAASALPIGFTNVGLDEIRTPIMLTRQVPDGTDTTEPRSAASVTLVAAGDIACDPGNSLYRSGHGVGGWCRASSVEKLIHRIDPDAVVPLGDEQYDTGTYDAFRKSYGASWGQERSRTYAVVGNHEYESSPSASGYFRYFGSHAGPNPRGYYSVTLGSWRLIVLNSNCSIVSCSPGSSQYTWLQTLIKNHPSQCTVAMMHHPLLSSGPHGDDESHARPLWKVLYRGGVDVALTAHDHIYERFAPVDASGRKDLATGIREFVVGTGGAEHYWIDTVHRYSQVRNTKTFGVLQMQLGDGTYHWRFRPISGSTFTDAGTGTCHGKP